MKTARSIGVGAALAAVVTGGTYALLDPEAALLAGVAAVYFAGGAVSAYRPAVWRVQGSKWTSLFTGVTTFGTLSLMAGLGTDPRFDVVVLALGLSSFAYVCGSVTAIEDVVGADAESASTD